jgi:hypothetical protein
MGMKKEKMTMKDHPANINLDPKREENTNYKK